MNNSVDKNPLIMKTFDFVKNISPLQFIKCPFIFQIIQYRAHGLLLVVISALILWTPHEDVFKSVTFEGFDLVFANLP